MAYSKFHRNRDKLKESNKERMRLTRARSHGEAIEREWASAHPILMPSARPDGEAIERAWAKVTPMVLQSKTTPNCIPRDEDNNNDNIDDNNDIDNNSDIDFCDLDPPRIPGDLRQHLNWSHWPKWSAERRLAALRRWVMYAELKYHSPLDRWAQSFDADFQYGVPLDDAATKKWRRGQAMIIAGQNAAGYLGRVMEGELPADDEVLRDVYVQAFQLSAVLHRAIGGLQHRLDFAQKSWYI